MIILILGLATLLRLILLNQSLWLDEAIEALALMGRQGPLLKYALGDFQPPLYHFLLYGWTHLVGFSEVALRLPSLLAGLVVVYLVIRLGQEFGGRRLGWIAGLLAATNPLLIYYSQEGRTYMLTAAFTTLLLFALVKRRSYLLALAAAGVVWTSYLGWILLGCLGVYLMVRKSWSLFWPLLAGCATIILWLPSFISSLGLGLSTASGSPGWGQVVGGFAWKSLPLTWVKFVLGRISFANKYLYAGIVGALVLLHGLALRRVRLKSALWPLLVWLAPIPLALALAAVIPVYQYFRVLFVLPAYLLLLAIGLSRFKTSALYLALIVLNFLALGYFWFTPAFHREDWRALVRDLPPRDGTWAIGMPSLAQDAPLLYYNVPASSLFEPKLGVSGSLPPRVFYIRYVEDLFDTGRQGPAKLTAAGYTIVNQEVYPGIAVDEYARSH